MAAYAITWVRHGELISQLIEHANDDYPFNFFTAKTADKNWKTYEAYENKFNDYRKTIIDQEIENYKQFKDRLSQQYEEEVVDLTQLQKEKFKNLLDYKTIDNLKSESFEAEIQRLLKPRKPLVESSPWFVNSIFSKQVSPSTWYFTPTLDSVGVLESKKFGTEYLKKNTEKYGAIICSPTVRTIMTALYALQAAGISGKEIIIIPYINERNITNKGVEERANVGIPLEILDKVIALIDTATGNMGSEKNTIITQYYKNEKPKHPDNYWEGGYFDRAKEIIEEIIEKTDSKNILAFVHGNFILDRIRALYNNVQPKPKRLPAMPFNCSAYELAYEKKTEEALSIIDDTTYTNEKANVRTSTANIIDEDKVDDKDINNGDCNLAKGNLRGDINHMWININTIPRARGTTSSGAQGGKKRKTKRRSKLKKRRKSKKRTNKNKRR